MTFKQFGAMMEIPRDFLQNDYVQYLLLAHHHTVDVFHLKNAQRLTRKVT